PVRGDPRRSPPSPSLRLVAPAPRCTFIMHWGWFASPVLQRTSDGDVTNPPWYAAASSSGASFPPAGGGHAVQGKRN
ncbi:unnamed protein product, partial [Ixodes hexagonus]